jgi:hypothetical protein
MKNVGIQKACSEDWSKMTPTEKGAFCNSCAKQVYDFTNKSNNEIKSTLLELQGQSICGRMTIKQELELNAEFDAWVRRNKTNFQHLFIAALMIVFGLTLFSCEDERDQQKIVAAQVAVKHIIEEKETPKEIQTVTTPLPPLEIAAPYEEVAEEFIVIEYDSIIKEMEEVEISAYRNEYVTSGVMINTREYIESIQPLVPESSEEPTEFKAIVFPNPAVESTTLELQFPEKESTEINLFDLSGKLIREIHSGKISRGTFQKEIDLSNLPAGIYLVVIQSKKFQEAVRIVKN